MSNAFVNIRIGSVHFQILRDRPWLRISRNDWHRDNGWPDGWFSVYQFFN